MLLLRDFKTTCLAPFPLHFPSQLAQFPLFPLIWAVVCVFCWQGAVIGTKYSISSLKTSAAVWAAGCVRLCVCVAILPRGGGGCNTRSLHTKTELFLCDVYLLYLCMLLHLFYFYIISLCCYIYFISMCCCIYFISMCYTFISFLCAVHSFYF